MVLTSEEQFARIIKKSQNILILIPSNADGDIIGSAWSIYNLSKQLGNNPTLIFPQWKKNIALKKFSFLDTPSNLQEKITGAQDFVLSFNTQHKKIIDTKVEQKENELRIYVTPEYGSFDPRDFSFIPSVFHYDLVITIGIPDKESLGEIYEKNPDIFYEIPVVNIDYHSHNDNFGQINLVNVVASSNSEIVYLFLEKYFSQNINHFILHSLLSGIISATNSFQRKNTTPRSLQISAQLIEKGADQQEIIRHLYKTQPLSLLKLWGKAMSKLKYDDGLGLAWTIITLEDFIQTRTQPYYLPEILTKIQNNYSNGKVFIAIFQEKSQKFKLFIKTTVPNIIEKMINNSRFQEENNLIVAYVSASNLEEAEKEALQLIKNTLN